ncbi:MAG: peptidoglycan DD-metalloendopeptidase family protein [Nitriliruptorales bacterium]|nr:peptidoglycan DD-metalloendopeptidase family protein [Nitriliruptorales bacterium]
MVLPARFFGALAVVVFATGIPEAVGEAAPNAVAVRPVEGRVERQYRPPATRFGAGHRGVDLRARAGTPVRAALGGTVTFAGDVARVGWVTVNHGGALETTYGPISPQVVRAGDRVSTGRLLGFVAPGADHLDWGARLHGAYIDPLGLLGTWETYLTTEEDDPFPPLGGVGTASASPRRLQRPTKGPMTSGFGPRAHPVTGVRRLHAGIDIGAVTGTSIRAAAAGTVTFAGDVSGYGRMVIVDHGDGLTTLYAHQSSTSVRTGQVIDAGEGLGRVGATGTATGPHLHFEVRVDGAAQDPMRWLRP